MENTLYRISTDLHSPYNEYALAGIWEMYSADLCTDGMNWLFNLKFNLLNVHLNPLTANLPLQEPPLRLTFFKTALSPEPSERLHETFFDAFDSIGDSDGKVAAGMAAVFAMMNQDTPATRHDFWYDRLDRLSLENTERSPTARAAMFMSMGLIDEHHRGDYRQAIARYQSAQCHAEKTRAAVSLKVFVAIRLCFCYLYTGQFPQIELILFDISPLIALPEIAPISLFCYLDLHSHFTYLKGDIARGKRELKKLDQRSFLDTIPVWCEMLLIAHRMEVAAVDRDTALIPELVERLQHPDIQKKDRCFHETLHYCQALAAFARGDPVNTLEHTAQVLAKAESGRRLQLVQCRGALLAGQALIELNRFSEAQTHFQHYLPRMNQSGMILLISAVHLEWAAALIRQGKVDAARNHFDTARQLIGTETPLIVMHRSAPYSKRLQHHLFPNPNRTDITTIGQIDPPMHIRTFGGLRIQIYGRTRYDRDWRGQRIKLLLKALIVHGGTKVPASLLVDLLWPDAEGDNALNSLRVTTSRLRLLGRRPDNRVLPWIKVKYGKVSLCRSLCTVDAIRFLNWCTKAVDESNLHLLRRALDLYTGDFLADDTTPSWIVDHRRALRKQYVRGLITLADDCLATHQNELAGQYLALAAANDRLNEKVWQALILTQLQTGQRRAALRSYQQIEQHLQDELNRKPSAQLRAIVHNLFT